MKTVFAQLKRSSKAAALSIFVCLSVSGAFAQEAANYNEYVAAKENTALVSLATEIHPSIYLDNGIVKKYGNGEAVALYTDAASIPMLYGENAAFSEVELIKVNIVSAKDETAKIDFSQLSAFKKLRFVLFVYQYDACGGNSEACLKDLTKGKVTTNATDDIQTLYLLSIPQ